MNTKTNKKDSSWINNKNATKNPKVFNATIYRDECGELHMVGGQTLVLNQQSNEWEKVNTRALAQLVNKQGVKFR